MEKISLSFLVGTLQQFTIFFIYISFYSSRESVAQYVSCKHGLDASVCRKNWKTFNSQHGPCNALSLYYLREIKKTYWKCWEAPSMKNGVISVVLSIHIYLYAFMLFKYWCIDVGVQLCFKQIWIQTKIAVWVVWFCMYRYPTPHAKNHSAYLVIWIWAEPSDRWV